MGTWLHHFGLVVTQYIMIEVCCRESLLTPWHPRSQEKGRRRLVSGMLFKDMSPVTELPSIRPHVLKAL